MKTQVIPHQEDSIRATLNSPYPSTPDQSVEVKEAEPLIELHPDDQPQLKEEKQVIVKLRASGFMRARIWPDSTTLVCKQSGCKSPLIHSEGIGKYPQWTEIPPRSPFILIFDPLPNDCVAFDLFEDIPEYGGFHITDIPRNRSGVYDLWIK